MIPRKFSLESSQYRCQACKNRITAMSPTHSLQPPLAFPLHRGGPKIKCSKWNIHTTWSEVQSQSTVHKKTSFSVLARSEIIESNFPWNRFYFPSWISNILTMWTDFLTRSKFYMYGSVLVMMGWFSMHCGFCLLLFNLKCSPPPLPGALDFSFFFWFLQRCTCFLCKPCQWSGFPLPFCVFWHAFKHH